MGDPMKIYIYCYSELRHLHSNIYLDTQRVIREYVDDRLKDFDHAQLPKKPYTQQITFTTLPA